MERICERRAAEGLPALAIQWGLIRDVGLFASKYDTNYSINGYCQQSIVSCLSLLARFLLQKQPVVSCMTLEEKKSSSKSLNIVDSVLQIMGKKFLQNDIYNRSLILSIFINFVRHFINFLLVIIDDFNLFDAYCRFSKFERG